MSRRLLVLVCAVFACAVLVAACGGDEGDSGEAGGGAATGAGATEGAKVIDPGLMEGAKGEVTYCQGKDTTGNLKDWMGRFNKKFAAQGLSVKAMEFPASADEQRIQFVQRQESKAGDCDVFAADVIWTAEFASQKWLYDLTPYMDTVKDRFIPATLASGTFEDRVWGIPKHAQSALIYYRTDRVDAPPATWQALNAEAAEQGGYVWQGAAYEGLTCVWLELAYAAGGSVLSEDGSTATIDSPENVAATKFLVDAISSGASPKGVTAYMEPDSLQAWQTGTYAFMRNWPYAYPLSQDTPKLKGKFAVAPLPEYEGATAAGILGGANHVISVYSENPGGALAVVDYLASEEWQIPYMATYAEPSALIAAYEAPEVKKAIPFSAELKQGIEQAKARPVSPVYPQISQAIYKNVNAALSGAVTPEEAMKEAQADIEGALQTF